MNNSVFNISIENMCSLFNGISKIIYAEITDSIKHKIRTLYGRDPIPKNVMDHIREFTENSAYIMNEDLYFTLRIDHGNESYDKINLYFVESMNNTVKAYITPKLFKNEIGVMDIIVSDNLFRSKNPKICFDITRELTYFIVSYFCNFQSHDIIYDIDNMEKYNAITNSDVDNMKRCLVLANVFASLLFKTESTFKIDVSKCVDKILETAIDNTTPYMRISDLSNFMDALGLVSIDLD